MSTASSPSARTVVRHAFVAVRALVLFTLVLGLGYTALVTAVGQLALPWQADGSLVRSPSGAVVGSALIGQSFTVAAPDGSMSDADAARTAAYLRSRPSAAGAGYDGTSSGGSNLGPENPDLVTAIRDRQARIAAADGVAASAIPADAVTASGSGLDPHISVAYALEQIDRIAAARHVDRAAVRALVESKIQQRDLGFLGEPRVNVLEVDLALDARFGAP